MADLQSQAGDNGEEVGAFMSFIGPILVGGLTDLAATRAALPPAQAKIFESAAGEEILKREENVGWRRLICIPHFIGTQVLLTVSDSCLDHDSTFGNLLCILSHFCSTSSHRVSRCLH